MDYYMRGELAKEAGLNFETLRYYEKVNLIPLVKRNNNGYRQYPKEILRRLKLIKILQNGGFTINEIKNVAIPLPMLNMYEVKLPKLLAIYCCTY